MHVFASNPKDIQEVCQLLRKGEVVGVPTETVYGLAADALHAEAVDRIFHIKGRPLHNPLIIHIGTASSADRYVRVNATAQRLMDAFWPGPLTLVLPKRNCIPDNVTAGLSTVGIRCPQHPALQKILQCLDRPLAAPSANPSNYLSPTRVEHVVEHLKGRLQWVLDGGPCERGVESTILDLTDPQHIQLLRPGPLSLESLEQVAGTSIASRNEPATSDSEDSAAARTSPGQLALHYSPRTPLRLLTAGASSSAIEAGKAPVARVHFSDQAAAHCSESPSEHHFFLTHQEEAKEAEHNLYALLQQIDHGDFSEIRIDPIPEGSAWNALRDRLTRASARRCSPNDER